jgi:5-methylcytosine-specific restriction endonuclease McrA
VRAPAGTSTTSAAARGYGAAHRRLRVAVLARDGHRCHWCGARADTSDHLVAKALGGRTVMANLVAACTPCNSRRGMETAALLAHRRRLRPSRRWLA